MDIDLEQFRGSPDPGLDLDQFRVELPPETDLLSSSGNYKIEDGDTVIDQRTGETYRLSGMDTPETAHTDKGWNRPELGSAEATQRTLDFINRIEATGSEPQFSRSGTDVYGRTLARIPGHAADMVRSGHALPEARVGDPEVEQALLDRRLAEARDGVQPLPGYEEATPEQYAAAQDRVRRLATAGVAPRALNSGGTFTRSVQRGLDQTAGLGGRALEALGQLTGIDAVEGAGRGIAERNEQRAERNLAEVPTWDEVHGVGDFGTFALERVGEQVANLALMAGTGGAGGMLAKRGAAALVEGLGATRAAEALAGRAIAGRLAGATAGGYPLAVGEVQQELNDAGIEAPGTAFLAGIPIAGLDALGFETMLGRFFGDGKKVVAKSLLEALAKEVPKAAGVGALTEAPTEYLQELMTVTARAMHDPGYEIFSDENLKRFRNAAIAGGIVGGAMGGAGGGVHSLGYEKPFALTPPPSGAGGAPTLGANDPNAGGSPAVTGPELEAAGQGRLPFGPPTQQTHAGAPTDAGRAPPDATAQQEDWWQSLPDDLEVDIDVVADSGEAGKATMPAKATALELRETREAYAALRACLAR